MCVFIYSANCVWNISHKRAQMFTYSPWQILIKLEFFDTISKKSHVSNFMKIRPVSFNFFRVDRRKNKRTDR